MKGTLLKSIQIEHASALKTGNEPVFIDNQPQNLLQTWKKLLKTTSVASYTVGNFQEKSVPVLLSVEFFFQAIIVQTGCNCRKCQYWTIVKKLLVVEKTF